MFKNISNSFKAKLYDFAYNPFMSSFIISWIVLNHKYLLIYFTEFSLDKKLLLLEQYDFSYLIFSVQIPSSLNFLIPIVFGLFYTFLYPKISKYFYKYTLNQNKKLKEIKQEIIDITPITNEEAKELRKFNNDLIEKNYQLEKQLATITEFNNTKQTFGITQTATTRSTDKLNNEEDDKTKFLRYLYENNYEPIEAKNFESYIVKGTKIPRPKVHKMFIELIEIDKILGIEELRHLTDGVFITPYGNERLLELFDKDYKNA